MVPEITIRISMVSEGAAISAVQTDGVAGDEIPMPPTLPEVEAEARLEVGAAPMPPLMSEAHMTEVPLPPTLPEVEDMGEGAESEPPAMLELEAGAGPGVDGVPEPPLP